METLHTASGTSPMIKARSVSYRVDFLGGTGEAQLEISKDDGETWLAADVLRTASMSSPAEAYLDTEGEPPQWRMRVELVHGGSVRTHLV